MIDNRDYNYGLTILGNIYNDCLYILFRANIKNPDKFVIYTNSEELYLEWNLFDVNNTLEYKVEIFITTDKNIRLTLIDYNAIGKTKNIPSAGIYNFDLNFTDILLSVKDIFHFSFSF